MEEITDDGDRRPLLCNDTKGEDEWRGWKGVRAQSILAVDSRTRLTIKKMLDVMLSIGKNKIGASPGRNQCLMLP